VIGAAMCIHEEWLHIAESGKIRHGESKARPTGAGFCIG